MASGGFPHPRCFAKCFRGSLSRFALVVRSRALVSLSWFALAVRSRGSLSRFAFVVPTQCITQMYSQTLVELQSNLHFIMQSKVRTATTRNRQLQNTAPQADNCVWQVDHLQSGNSSMQPPPQPDACFNLNCAISRAKWCSNGFGAVRSVPFT